MLNSKFEARRLTSAHENEVVEFMTSYYSQAYFRPAYCVDETDNYDEYNAIRVRNGLKLNWSVGVFEKSTDNLVGVMLNSIRQKPQRYDLAEFEEAGFELSPKLLKNDKFFADFEAEIFELLDEEELFYFGMAAVHTEFRNQGVFSVVISACYELAKMSGCRYMYTTSTTDLLIQMLQHHGWSVVKETKCSDYDTKNNTNLFRAKYPFTSNRLAYKEVKTLPQKSVLTAKLK